MYAAIASDFAPSARTQNEKTINGLLHNSTYGICLRLKQHVLATHQELRVLRRCAEMLRDQSQRIIHVVTATDKPKSDFIVNTLLHLGVSCGRIKISAVDSTADETQDIWLFVTDH